MNTFKKNQIIITALAIMIAIAGYLNFTDRADAKKDQTVFNNEVGEVITNSNTKGAIVPNDEELTNTAVIEEPDYTFDISDADGLQILDPNAIIDGNTTEQALSQDNLNLISEEANTTDITGDAVLVTSNSVSSSYFLEHKIKREQVRASSFDSLLQYINSENLTEADKLSTTNRILELQSCIDKETACETLIEAKGFSDVFVRINKIDVAVPSVDVVVNASSLTQSDLAQITELVSRETGIDPTQVIITPIKIE